MIEQMVRDYLIRKTKIPAFMEKEPDMPKEYFLIEKTGSGKDNHIRQATLAIKSYSTSLYQAAVLNEKLKAAMENIMK